MEIISYDEIIAIRTAIKEGKSKDSTTRERDERDLIGKLDDMKAQFLAKGGKVKQIPYGETKSTGDVPIALLNKQAAERRIEKLRAESD